MSQKVKKVLWLGLFALGSSSDLESGHKSVKQQSMHTEKNVFFKFRTASPIKLMTVS
jgi:hypothetical protein